MSIAEATGLNASQLINIMSNDPSEANLNEFNRFENLKQTLDFEKTKLFLSKVYDTEIPGRRVMIKADDVLRKFILEPEMRARIIAAYVTDGVSIETVEVDNDKPIESADEVLEKPEDGVADIDKIHAAMKDVLKNTLGGLSNSMRPLDEVVNSLFTVLGTASVSNLDSVGLYIGDALKRLFVENASIVNKFVGFNLLSTKFEAYLKKLYYVAHNREVRAQYDGDDATWKDAIHAFPCLWNLKRTDGDDYQRLYQYLEMAKSWRNDESHISPTASEQELTAAINIMITLYCYVTGNTITQLEIAGVM
jgi:type I restriction enzyme R subunit